MRPRCISRTFFSPRGCPPPLEKGPLSQSCPALRGSRRPGQASRNQKLIPLHRTGRRPCVFSRETVHSPGGGPDTPGLTRPRSRSPVSRWPSVPVLALCPRAGLPVSCSYGRLLPPLSVLHDGLGLCPDGLRTPRTPLPISPSPTAQLSIRGPQSAARVQEIWSHACELFSLWAPWGALPAAPQC